MLRSALTRAHARRYMLIYRRVDPSVNIDHVTSAMIPQKLRESIEVYQAKLDEQAKAVREAIY